MQVNIVWYLILKLLKPFVSLSYRYKSIIAPEMYMRDLPPWPLVTGVLQSIPCCTGSYYNSTRLHAVQVLNLADHRSCEMPGWSLWSLLNLISVSLDPNVVLEQARNCTRASADAVMIRFGMFSPRLHIHCRHCQMHFVDRRLMYLQVCKSA